MTSEYEGWSAVFAFCGSVVSVGVILVYLKDVLVPFVLAIFLAYLVRPFAEWISAHLCVCRRRMRTPKGIGDSDAADETESLLPKSIGRSATVGDMLVEEATQRLPQWVGVVLAMMLAFGLFGSVLVLMASSASSLGSRLDAYQQRAHDLWAIAVFHLRPLGLDLPDTLIIPSKAISAYIGSALNAGLGLLNEFILVLIFLVFLLLEPPTSRSILRRRIDDSVSRYLVLKSLICVSLAAFTFLVLSVLDFPLALFLSIVTCILSFIPNLGPMVAVLMPLPICLLDVSVPPGSAILCIIIPGIAHLLCGNILEPKLFGAQFRMSPVVILFSLGVWWILWGIVGAMLAVPLTSILRLIASDLMQNGEAGYYIVVLNQLLEGRIEMERPASASRAATPSTAAEAADDFKNV